MVRIHEEFLSEANAVEWRDAYLRSYHPAGYGTSLSILPPSARSGRQHWTVAGSRYSSCD